MSRISYVPAIDGLRTLAILPVVFFHLGFSWIPGGFAGVDVFFVISGYLITSIILDECHSGTFSFLNFWKRRIRRILPALIAMVIVTSVVGYCLRYGRDVQDIGLQGAAAIASLANVCLWIMAGDYWGSAAENALFLHTWSLSVEEQFYLFFPLFLFLVIRFIPQHIFKAVSALAICSLMLYVFGADRYPVETFYLLPARIWELAAGSLLAVGLNHSTWRTNRLQGYLAICGVATVIFSYFFMSENAVSNGALFFPVAGAALVILDHNNRSSFVNRVLASESMVYVGKLSYSMYLWHWPITVFSREFFADSNRLIVNVAVIFLTVLLSLLSYYFIEKTTRHYKHALPGIALAVVVSLILSGYLYGVGKYYDVSMYNKVVWNGPVYDVAPIEADSVGRWEREGLLIGRPDKFDGQAYANSGVLRIYGSGNPDVVVIGSSIALMFSGVIDDIAKDMGFNVAFFGARGTPVFPESDLSRIKNENFFTDKEKLVFDENRMKKILIWRPKVVVVAGNWTSIYSEYDKNNAINFVKKMGEIGTKVILIEQPPLLDIHGKTLVQYLVHNKIFPEGSSSKYIKELKSDRYVSGNTFINKIASECSYCYYMPTRDIFVKDSAGVLVVEGRDVLYRDEGHLSGYGSLKIKNKLKEKLESMLGDR